MELDKTFFKFKRLLFLGAGNYQLPAIKKAKELGCIVITASFDKNDVGHVFSDYSLDISVDDKEKILQAAKDYKIDAIMTYAANYPVETVSYVAEKLNLPGNPVKAAQILQNKAKFRAFQKENGLTHPDFIIVNQEYNVEEIRNKLQDFDWIVKPVDLGGSVGQSVINKSDNIKEKIDNAINSSISKSAIIERKLSPTMLELDGDVFFQDGHFEFALYGHNYFKKSLSANVPVGEIFPADLPEDIKLKLNNQFKVIIQKLNLNSGCINFDGFVCGNEVCIIDIALRNGGNFVPEMIKYSSGFDMTEASVYAAFGRTYKYEPKKIFIPVVSYIISADRKGTFNGINILPAAYKNILFVNQFADYTDVVKPFTVGHNTLGVVGFKLKEQKEAIDFADKVENFVKVNIDETNSPIGTIGQKASSFMNAKIKDTDEKTKQVLKSQFYSPDDKKILNSSESEFVKKHYEAGLEYRVGGGKKINGLERLYKRQLVIEPILECCANCKHCLRQNYLPFNMSEDTFLKIAECLEKDNQFEDIRELLITGGDPLLLKNRLRKFLDELALRKTKIKTVRIASRLPVHDPYLVNDNIIALFKKKYPFRIEMATQINHKAELFDKTKEVFAKIRKYVPIYNQTVLLAGVNDNEEALIELCDELRDMGIENHYIFHCCPLKEANKFLTNVQNSAKLISKVTSSGKFSGRAKPQFALMTDIGKITLYEGCIIDSKDDKILLQSNYLYSDRIKWNPSWKLPKNAEIDENGYLRVWYFNKKEHGG